jgi:uncharacterized protein involved in exopolysaccharide biosynthesis
MGVVTDRPGLPLWSDYLGFVRRHAVAIGVLTVVGLAAGIAWSLQQPASFSATTSVALAPVPKYVVPSTTELVAPEVTVDTDAQLLQSPQVLDAIATALGTDPDVASEHLSVTAAPNSHVLNVTVEASSPERAATAANAAVAALIEVRRDVLGSLREDQLRQLRLLIATQERVLARQQAIRLVVPATDDLFAQVFELREELEELEEAGRQPAEVVRPAEPPRTKDYANTEVPLTSGLMLGLLAGCLLGAGRDLARQHTRSTFPRPVPILAGHQPVVTTLHEDRNHAN